MHEANDIAAHASAAYRQTESNIACLPRSDLDRDTAIRAAAKTVALISRYDIKISMTRILADLPDDDIKWLDRLAEEQGKSRAAVLREAVSAYRAETPKDWLEIGFGAWKSRTDIGDAVEWQRRERASSTRPWDDDYEEVRAEFPDLFDDEDDRQRQIYLDMMVGKYPTPKKPPAS